MRSARGQSIWAGSHQRSVSKFPSVFIIFSFFLASFSAFLLILLVSFGFWFCWAGFWLFQTYFFSNLQNCSNSKFVQNLKFVHVDNCSYLKFVQIWFFFQIRNFFIVWICSYFKFGQMQKKFIFEICSNLKFVEIQNLFKSEICSNKKNSNPKNQIKMCSLICSKFKFV
jgi:hypothetical protein